MEQFGFVTKRCPNRETSKMWRRKVFSPRPNTSISIRLELRKLLWALLRQDGAHSFLFFDCELNIPQKAQNAVTEKKLAKWVWAKTWTHNERWKLTFIGNPDKNGVKKHCAMGTSKLWIMRLIIFLLFTSLIRLWTYFYAVCQASFL